LPNSGKVEPGGTLVDKELLYHKLKESLIELFEVSEEDIKPEARLGEDLDLDSIDVIDLIEKLEDVTKRRIEPVDFKSIRTVQDLTDRLYDLLEKRET
jgi:acyl carrier protein